MSLYPQFEPVVKSWQSGEPFFPTRWNPPRYNYTTMFTDIPWGETRSTWIEFNQLVLSMISTRPDFFREAEKVIRPECDYTRRTPREVWEARATEVINARPRPWEFQLKAAAVELSGDVSDRFRPWYLCGMSDKPKYVPKLRFSAAALAIRFLDSCWRERHHVRNIILHEDQAAINYPPAHVQGLIPYCLDNPRLRIERVVDLWNAGIYPTRRHTGPLTTDQATRSIGSWIFETLESQKRGLPKGSFRLILNGAPIADKASEIFEALKGSASRQAAMDICSDRGTLPRLSWYERRRWGNGAYEWERLPEVIENLQSGSFKSFIDCDFDLGAAMDPQSLIEERKGWTMDQWQDEWITWADAEFDTEPPLPKWREIHPKGCKSPL